VTNARAFYTTRAAAGAAGTRLSLRPLFFWVLHANNSDALRRENAETCPDLTSLRGAQRRSNPAFEFAVRWIASLALAMTTQDRLFEI
jgi:hypothetical protein